MDETLTDDIKDSSWWNNESDTMNVCTANPKTTIAVMSNAENGASSKSPKIYGQQAKCKTDEDVDWNIRTWYGRILKNLRH